MIEWDLGSRYSGNSIRDALQKYLINTPLIKLHATETYSAITFMIIFKILYNKKRELHSRKKKKENLDVMLKSDSNRLYTPSYIRPTWLPSIKSLGPND